MPRNKKHPALDNQFLAALLETMDDAVVVLDAEARVILFNAGAVKMFGHSEQAMLGQSLDVLLPDAVRPHHEALYKAFLAGEDPSRPMALRRPVRAVRASGEIFPVAATIVRVRSGHGGLGAAVLRDMSEQAQREAELLRLSTTDVLTGLCNRRCLLERAQQEVAQAQRHAAPLSMLVLDMDHFKSVNDRHGHAEGDRVLVRMAECLRAELRQGDTAGRLGGEEFAVVLPRTSINHASEVAERIRHCVEACGELLTPPVTVSIGAAELRPGEQVIDLLRRGDQALYRAKATGRNRACLAD